MQYILSIYHKNRSSSIRTVTLDNCEQFILLDVQLQVKAQRTWIERIRSGTSSFRSLFENAFLVTCERHLSKGDSVSSAFSDTQALLLE